MNDLQLREGMNVRVFQKITEGKRERNVPFVGKILKVRGSGINRTITVMQILEGIGVEKIFPTALPTITKIEIVEEEKKQISPKGKRTRSKKTATKSRSKK